MPTNHDQEKELSRGAGSTASEAVSEELLSVRNLEVQYTAAGEVIHAVNGVSFTVNKGETLGLVGETGAGKTTIAKAILRILPDPPAKVKNGEIFLEGKDLFKLPEKEMRSVRGEKISMIFQDPMTALNPVMTIGAQISEAISLHNKNLSPAEVESHACEMLEKVGIPASRYSDYPHQFSGGMKQRVVIAMALACNPTLILADEPTTALDVTIQAQVLDMMKALREEQNTSMILITHDLGVVAETCDKVAVVYAGQIIEMGTLEDIFDHPTHPYTLGLFGSLPTLSGDQHRLHAIDGMPPNPADLPSGCKFHPRCPRVCDRCRSSDIELSCIGGTHYCRCCLIQEETRT